MHSVVTGLFIPSLMNRDYTLTEKINLWRAKMVGGVSVLSPTMLATDLETALPQLEIPVHFLEGRFDYTCSYDVARAYFDHLKAPVKGFYTFEPVA